MFALGIGALSTFQILSVESIPFIGENTVGMSARFSMQTFSKNVKRHKEGSFEPFFYLCDHRKA